MKKYSFVLFLVMTLSACANNSTSSAYTYSYAVPTGSTLQLNTTLEIMPEQVSVYMQNGKVVAEDVIDRYYPYCKFEIYSIDDSRRQVEPDRFTIRRVVDEMEETAALATQQFASLNLVSNGPIVYTYVTNMYLHSDNQPDVYRMACMHWESVLDDNYLTAEQMRTAMGDLFTLKLAQ